MQATEFLSLGVYIDVNFSATSDTKTEITIEVRRKIGAFDKTYEVSQANEHIQNIITSISNGINLTEEQKQQIKLKNAPNLASAVKIPESTKFTCGICKQNFWANGMKVRFVICPHCQKSNSIPRVEPTPPVSKQILGGIVLIAIIVMVVYFFTH